MRLLTLTKAARLIGIDRSTLRRWIDAGDIRAVRLTNGRRRIPESEIARVAAPVIAQGAA